MKKLWLLPMYVLWCQICVCLGQEMGAQNERSNAVGQDMATEKGAKEKLTFCHCLLDCLFPEAYDYYNITLTEEDKAQLRGKSEKRLKFYLMGKCYRFVQKYEPPTTTTIGTTTTTTATTYTRERTVNNYNKAKERERTLKGRTIFSAIFMFSCFLLLSYCCCSDSGSSSDDNGEAFQWGVDNTVPKGVLQGPTALNDCIVKVPSTSGIRDPTALNDCDVEAARISGIRSPTSLGSYPAGGAETPTGAEASSRLLYQNSAPVSQRAGSGHQAHQRPGPVPTSAARVSASHGNTKLRPGAETPPPAYSDVVDA